MSEKGAIDIVKDFKETYLRKIKNYTLNELANKVGLEIHDIYDTKDLIDIVNQCMFVDMLCYRPFLQLPVLGHFIINGTHFFAFASNGTETCECCNIEYPVYCSVCISEAEYGLVSNIACKKNRVTFSEFETFNDVAKFFAKNTDIFKSAHLI